jgi:RNA polymerase sigma factor (sigma-70 family)
MPDEPTSPSPSFAEVFAGLERGDQDAARSLYERFIEQLIRMAGRKLQNKLVSRADPESVAHSVFESFFDGVNRKRFELRNWGMVLGLLAKITLRKCLRRKRQEMQARRFPGAKLNPLEEWEAIAATPGPDEEAMMADLMTTALADFDADERTVIDEYMKEQTVDSVTQHVKLSERTVHRIIARFRRRLEELTDRE